MLTFLSERYPMKMAEAVAADIGVGVATIRKLEERGSAPSLALFWRMADVYGASFLYAVFGFEWLNAAAGEQEARQLETSIEAQASLLTRVREAHR